MEVSRHMATRDHRRDPLPDRFWLKVRRGEGCWLWTGGKFADGYGRISSKNQAQRAHRVAYQLTKGDIPTGMMVCHHCDNPLCCRPDHLFVGTASDNTRDAANKGRMAVCAANANAKLSAEQVCELREAFGRGDSKWVLAARYALNENMVLNIVTGRHWRSAPGPIFRANKRGSSKPIYTAVR